MSKKLAKLLARVNRIEVTKMYAMQWILGIFLTGLVCLVLAGAPDKILELVVFYLGIAGLVAMVTFVYAFFWKPERLESEDYQLKKKETGAEREKPETGNEK